MEALGEMEQMIEKGINYQLQLTERKREFLFVSFLEKFAYLGIGSRCWEVRAAAHGGGVEEWATDLSLTVLKRLEMSHGWFFDSWSITLQVAIFTLRLFWYSEASSLCLHCRCFVLKNSCMSPGANKLLPKGRREEENGRIG